MVYTHDSPQYTSLRSVTTGQAKSCHKFFVRRSNAEVVKLVYTHDSKSCGETHEGSTPSFGTIWFAVRVPARPKFKERRWVSRGTILYLMLPRLTIMTGCGAVS